MASGSQPPNDGGTKSPDLISSPTKHKSFAGLFATKPSTLIPPSSFKGEPALRISQELVNNLLKPFNLMLIGKFSRGQPSMAETRQVFRNSI